MKLQQPFDGRIRPTIFAPKPIGYRIKKTPRSRKLWTFCEKEVNAMAALNTLRAAGYKNALVEPMYL